MTYHVWTEDLFHIVVSVTWNGHVYEVMRVSRSFCSKKHLKTLYPQLFPEV